MSVQMSYSTTPAKVDAELAEQTQKVCNIALHPSALALSVMTDKRFTANQRQ